MIFDYRDISLDTASNIPAHFINKSVILKSPRCKDCYFFKEEFCMINQMSLSGNTASCTDYISSDTDLSGKIFVRDEEGNLRISEDFDIPHIQMNAEKEILQQKNKLTLADVMADDNNIIPD